MKIATTRLLSHYAELRSSPIHGMGLFAKRPIPAHTIWWKARKNNVLLLNQTQYETLLNSHINGLMENLRTMARVYGYYSSQLDSIIVCLDNARYVNHSIEPNSGAPPNRDPLCSMTLREIREGEEIMEDYSTYDICTWTDITCSDEFLTNRTCLPSDSPKNYA